jgi:hypothetical protein
VLTEPRYTWCGSPSPSSAPPPPPPPRAAAAASEVLAMSMARTLVDLVKKKVPNSTPQLVCHAPKPSREIEIDLSR